MGTDEVGRDLAERVLGRHPHLAHASPRWRRSPRSSSARSSGCSRATLGGRVDALVMRAVDVLSSQNHFLFGILLVVLFRPALGGAGAIMLAVGLTHWPSLARIVRGELLSVRERPFVAAAIGGGANRRRLARRHYLPHLLPAVGLAFVLTVPHAIFHESAYSFLGLGLEAHRASLGNILADGQRSLLAGGWWIALFPGLAILLASTDDRVARRALARTAAPTLAIGAGAMTLLDLTDLSVGFRTRARRRAGAVERVAEHRARRAAARASARAGAARPCSRTRCCGCCRATPMSAARSGSTARELLDLPARELRRVRAAGWR